MSDRPPLTFEIPAHAIPTDRWVARVNALARKMDDQAASLHPSAWPEMMAADNEKFKCLAAHSKLDE